MTGWSNTRFDWTNSAAFRFIWECWLQLCEDQKGRRQPAAHLQAPTRSFGLVETILGSTWTTVKQSRINVLIRNVTSVPGNYSYHCSFHDFETLCIRCVFSCRSKCMNLHMVYLNWLQVVDESNSRHAWSWWLSKLRDTFGDYCGTITAMNLEAKVKEVWR